MRRLLPPLALLAVLVVPTAAIGQGPTGPTGPTGPSGPSGPTGPTVAPRVVAAASGGVTIKDFSFGPKSVTINVGDSVSWTNQGPTAHTATAKNGSFNSGLLQAGKSYSHKFTAAGSFVYYCQPHPFMTATVVVKAASGSGSDSGGGGSSGGSGSSGSGSGTTTTPADPAAAAPAATTGGLPNTGSDVAPWIFLGVSLIAFGAALRWRLNTE